MLIRDVPSSDLDQIRAAAAAQGTSLQSYLRETVHAQATYLRRQEALARTARRLQHRNAVPEEAREAVLDAVDAAHNERTDELTDQQ